MLVADDSIVYRKLLGDIINKRDDIELIGVAPNGSIALAKIEQKKPDLVLLDIAMPEKDGLEILKTVKEKKLNTDVIFVSGMNRENAEITVKALELGALDFIPKPQTDSPKESINEITSALAPLLNLAKTRAYTRWAKDPSSRITKPVKPATPEAPARAPGPGIARVEPKPIVVPGKRVIPRIDAVAIGVSTGGPNALNKIVPIFSADLPVPIFTVQHMPPTFTASLAERLNKSSAIEVVEAKAGMEIGKGVMYIAPGGRHMVVRNGSSNKRSIGLTDTPPVHNCRPAVDVLFRSIAMVYGKNILSIILTGMGSDGAAGVATIRRNGGYCIVQDEASSVVWGMPGAVFTAGDADEVLDLDQIPLKVNDIVKR